MEKKIEFITKVRINGVYHSSDDMPEEEIRKAVQRSVDAALAAMNYEKQAAG